MKKGFSLLEVVVAILIFTLSFTVIYSLLERSLKNSAFAFSLWKEFLLLDKSYKVGNFTNLSVETRKDTKYGVEYRIYKTQNGTLFFVEIKE
jgi:prepilin-type N-terminal cleavage/methylation domain-containing protein